MLHVGKRFITLQLVWVIDGQIFASWQHMGRIIILDTSVNIENVRMRMEKSLYRTDSSYSRFVIDMFSRKSLNFLKNIFDLITVV